MIRFVAPALLSAEREASLARTIELGVLASHARAQPWRTDASASELDLIAAEGRHAWEQFLLANLRLVALLARHASGRSGLDFDELFQEGCLALGRALQRFDHTRGRFSTYAFPMVHQHLTRVTSSLAGQLGVPATRAVAVRRALSVADRLGQELGHTADLTEISRELGRDRQWTARLLHHRPPLSLDAIAQLPARQPGPAEGWEEGLGSSGLEPVIRRLPSDQRAVLGLRFGFLGGRCHSYRDVGRRLGISAASARRIEQRGLEALRRQSDSALTSEAG